MKEKMSFKTSILLSNVVLGALVLIQAIAEIVFKCEVEVTKMLPTTKNEVINIVVGYAVLVYIIVLFVLHKRGIIRFNEEEKQIFLDAVYLTALVMIVFVMTIDALLITFGVDVSIGAGTLFVPVGIALIFNGLLTLRFSRRLMCETR